MALLAWEQLASAGVFHYHDKKMRKMIMTDPSVIRYGTNKFQKWLYKWFGSNRGTHWTVAGCIAVIILGSYLIANMGNGQPTTTISAGERAPTPMIPGPFTSKQ
jgi:hypothetical protein